MDEKKDPSPNFEDDVKKSFPDLFKQEEPRDYANLILKSTYEIKGQLNLLREDIRQQSRTVINILAVIGILLFAILLK